ncbi:MAG: aminomethyltransferase, partial [Cryptosporangiaceae bacterium]|nr:aminomethyltransferase [Cryptosporangiaceae bacterium]
MTGLRRSPLHDRHVALGAKLADFGGWEMPIEYPGSTGGVLREHAAVRSAVGVFDVSHLGKASIVGPGAAEFTNGILTNDLGRIAPGQAQYTLCCDVSGGVVDDLIAYLVSPGEVFLVPNAANTAEVARRIAEAAPETITVTDRHEDFGVLAVQGPESDALLDRLGLPHGHDYMSYVDADWRGVPVRVCRTGYTGERGYELLPPWGAAGELFGALLDSGATPCGLGARDTLRTEMGYPLHGQHAVLAMLVEHLHAGRGLGLQPGHHLGRVRRVRHEEHVVVVDEVGDEVVHDPAGRVAAQRVLRLPRADATEVVGQRRVDVRAGAGTPHHGLAQ